MRILAGQLPAQNPQSDGIQPAAANPSAPVPAAAPMVAKPPAVPAYYEFRDNLVAQSSQPSIPAAAQSAPKEEAKVEKKEKPITSPLGRRPRGTREVNSDDERLQRPQANTEETLLTLLRKNGFQIRPMAEDGNCLFRFAELPRMSFNLYRAIADQVYGDPEMHDVVRKNAMDYIVRHKKSC